MLEVLACIGLRTEKRASGETPPPVFRSSLGRYLHGPPCSIQLGGDTVKPLRLAQPVVVVVVLAAGIWYLWLHW